MGKQGPCCHCGVTSTPLWRNGPSEKPVLCNACGSRWRTKGTLANYTPLHARADLDNYEDHRVSRMKSISLNKNKDAKPLKRKPNHDNVAIGGFFPDYNHGYKKVIDEDASNRSSSGSAISNSESCAQFGSADASDLTGQAQSNVWDTLVPSKKRTCVNRLKQSSFEKLTKDLYTIWHEQQSSSCFSGCSEEELLFESEGPMVSVEIGHGSVLIRHPSSIARDEESEASSLSVENKVYVTNEAYSNSVAFPVYNENKNVNIPSPGIEKAKNPAGQWMLQEQLKRDKSQHERTEFLANHNSPLCDVDLNDILNLEEFAGCLTKEEQQQLLKYLPPIDNSRLPDSIKCMFDSPQFKENISCYQQLLGEGLFDLSFTGAKTEDCNTLKRLTLSNFSKSKWVEYYRRLKCKNSTGKSPIGREPNIVTSSNMVKIPEVKMKSPKRVNMKAASENKEMESDGSCFSPRSLFALPPNGGPFMLDSIQYGDENSEQDLLVDVPSYGSFPQAELLRPVLSVGQQPQPQASTSSSSTYPNLFYP